MLTNYTHVYFVSVVFFTASHGTTRRRTKTSKKNGASRRLTKGKQQSSSEHKKYGPGTNFTLELMAMSLISILLVFSCVFVFLSSFLFYETAPSGGGLWGPLPPRKKAGGSGGAKPH